jgi:hypothetical protein
MRTGGSQIYEVRRERVREVRVVENGTAKFESRRSRNHKAWEKKDRALSEAPDGSI